MKQKAMDYEMIKLTKDIVDNYFPGLLYDVHVCYNKPSCELVIVAREDKIPVHQIRQFVIEHIKNLYPQDYDKFTIDSDMIIFPNGSFIAIIDQKDAMTPRYGKLRDYIL